MASGHRGGQLAPGYNFEPEAVAAAPPCEAFWTSPWAALQCLNGNSETLAFLGSSASTRSRWQRLAGIPMDQFFGIAIFITSVAFALYSLKDVHRFVMLLAKNSVEQQQQQQQQAAAPASDDDGKGKLVAQIGSDKEDMKDSTSDGTGNGEHWSVLAIVGLTSYRFYTGFLSATWLPYLLAMEGEDLWQEKQSMFMGIAKLIYGGTILLNPVFGLVGDQAVALSHGVGRRLFVRVGITTAALGIYICVLSAREHAFLSFLSGILVWRLGEAMNDVTTEALVPEMVPQEQYQMASGIKACSFLLGGLFGYGILMMFADIHYSWLYYAYPIGMFTCAMPSLILLDKDTPFPLKHKRETDEQEPFIQSLAKAYLIPTQYRGGFPRACLAVFIFSLGTAPMFFLLLIVRDLVGIEDSVRMQQHFSGGSIVFFLSAAVASVTVAALDPAKRRGGQAATAASAEPGQEEGQQAEQPAAQPGRSWAAAEFLEQRGKLLVWAMSIFGVIVLMIPGLGLFVEARSRDRAYYMMTAVFGSAFGVSFSLFQDLTWQVLPPEVNFANAMGFNVMSRLLGVGLGNFICGIFLDLSYKGGGEGEKTVYEPIGYVLMCTFSGCAVLMSTVVASSAIRLARQADMDERGEGEPRRAA